MAKMFLIDTNIFLEILLEQNKSKNCLNFLKLNSGNLFFTDFSLHSISVILFKFKKISIYKNFLRDILPNIKLLTLPLDSYKSLADITKQSKLDFDDAYQYGVAKHYNLKIVTLDKDFKNITNIKVIFL